MIRRWTHKNKLYKTCRKVKSRILEYKWSIVRRRCTILPSSGITTHKIKKVVKFIMFTYCKILEHFYSKVYTFSYKNTCLSMFGLVTYITTQQEILVTWQLVRVVVTYFYSVWPHKSIFSFNQSNKESFDSRYLTKRKTT